MMSQLEIRDEISADFEGVRKVICAAFPTTAEADLVDRLRENGNLLVSLVADMDSEVIGHIAFSPVRINGQQVSAVGLAPLAVAPDSQRQGIGAKLIQAGLAACLRSNVAFVVVLGEPAYYRRFGFETAASHGLADEYGGGDAFMVAELQTGALATVNGVVRYGSEFAVFS